MPQRLGWLTVTALTAASLLVGCGQFGASGWQACTWVYARDTDHRLFDVFSLDGGEEDRLTDGERSDTPSLSPDGKRIVFTRGVGGWEECCGFPNTELYVMDADGDDQRRLLDGEGDDDSPVWSPDGSMIAFIRTLRSRQALDQDSKKLLMVVPVFEGKAGQPRVIAEVHSFRVPAWSPDSTRLAWVDAPQRPSAPDRDSPRPPLRPSPESSEHSHQSALPPGIHRVSPVPPPDATLVSPDVEFRPPRGMRPPSRPSPPPATVQWKEVAGAESGKLSAPEGSDSAPVWIDNDHLVFSVNPLGPIPKRDLVRIRISDSTITSLGVPVALPARMPGGQIAGIVQGDKPDDSQLVVVDTGRKGYQAVAKIRMKYPYRGMTISAVCPE